MLVAGIALHSGTGGALCSPQRHMTDTFASPPTLLRHAVFLTRGGDAASSAPAVRIGQGAFLALRLVDLLRSEPATEADVFHYQWSATERYCRELEIVSPETSHLLAVVQSARDASRCDVSRETISS